MCIYYLVVVLTFDPPSVVLVRVEGTVPGTLFSFVVKFKASEALIKS